MRQLALADISDPDERLEMGWAGQSEPMPHACLHDGQVFADLTEYDVDDGARGAREKGTLWLLIYGLKYSIKSAEDSTSPGLRLAGS